MPLWNKPLAKPAGILARAEAAQQDILAGNIVSWDQGPRDAFETLTLANLFGLDYVNVDRATAMSIGAVAKVRKTACGFIGRMPLVAYRGNTVLARQPKIVTQPEAGRPRFVTMAWVTEALMFYGRAWFTVQERYKEDGRPAVLRWVPEWSAELDTAGNLVKAFGVAVDRADVIRVDGIDEGLLNYGQDTLREARAVDLAAGRAADNPVPSIDLHQTGGDPLTNDQIDALIDRWATNRRAKNGGVSFTNQSVEAKTMGQPVEQLLIDGRNVAALNIARATGMPAWVVDASVNGSAITYSNSPSRTRELIDYGLAPYMAAIEARFSMDDILPAGTWCRFDYSDLLRGDFAARMDAYKVAKDAGIYTVEELRAMELGRPLEVAE